MVVRAGEYDWSTMCDALPPAKGKEMKRAYWACISVRKWLLLLCQSLTSKCLNDLL